MNGIAWIVALVGEHVHHGHANQCVISDISKLDNVRKKIKEEHGLEFSEYDSSPSSMWWRKYANTSDARDISLLVERTFVFTEEDLPLK